MARRWLRVAKWTAALVVALVAVRVGAALNRTEPTALPPVPTHGADAFGDPLPEHAIARLGTIRFRCGGPGVWSADGKHLFVQGWDDDVLAMDAETGLVDWTLPGHAGTFTYPLRLGDLEGVVWRGALPESLDILQSIALTPDGRSLVTAGNSVRTWDIATRTQTRMFPLRGGSNWPAVVSPDGTLAAIPWCQSIRFVELDGRRERPRRIELPANANHVVWMPSGEAVVVALAKGSVAIARIDGPKPIACKVSDVNLCDVMVTRDGGELWTLDVQGVVTVRPVLALDAVSHRIERPAGAPDGNWGGSLQLSPDGRVVAVSWAARPMRWLDVATAQPVRGPTEEGAFPVIGWSRDGRLFAGWRNGVARVFGESAPQQPDASGDVRTVAFSPDGRSLVTGSSTGVVQAWDVENARNRWRRELAAGSRTVAWSPDGALVFALGREGGLLRLEPSTGQDAPVGSREPLQPVTSLDRLGVAAWRRGEDERLHLVDLREPSINRSSGLAPTLEPAEIQRLAVSADLRRVAAVVRVPTGPGGTQATLRVWREGVGGDPTDTNTTDLEVLAMSTDGRLVASGGTIVVVHDLSVSPPREIGRVTVPRRERQHSYWRFWREASASISPDGTLLAVGDANGTVHVFALPSCAEVRTLRGHRAAVLSVAFSPDGSKLVTGSADTTALVWDLRD